jgi:hypothetical protein
MTEFRIRDASQNNKIIGFVKSETLLLALQKTAWATGLDITQLFADPIKA